MLTVLATAQLALFHLFNSCLLPKVTNVHLDIVSRVLVWCYCWKIIQDKILQYALICRHTVIKCANRHVHLIQAQALKKTQTKGWRPLHLTTESGFIPKPTGPKESRTVKDNSLFYSCKAPNTLTAATRETPTLM